MSLDEWCKRETLEIDGHQLELFEVIPADRDTGIAKTAAVIPGHYACEKQVARALRRLGKEAAANLVELRLPTTRNIRSGDLGEIYATEWIGAHSGGYSAPIKRLRWKDHRNMAMRGEDVIGMRLDPASRRLSFLKTEAKSRARLTAQVLSGARAGLDKDQGLPSAHALSFIAGRLHDLAEHPLADAIDDALLKNGIHAQDVRHLLFTLTGNDPQALLTASLQAYAGDMVQFGVGIKVDEHADFVSAVYDRVIANANDA
jgi:hypothetical protein